MMKRTTHTPDANAAPAREASSRGGYLLGMNWNEVFDYDPETGVLRWKSERPRNHFDSEKGFRVWHGQYAGKVAGSVTPRGYIAVKVYGVNYQVHRIAYEMAHGPLFDYHIDHIDGNTSNNKASNLRPATREENMRNRKMHSNNSCGYKGVYHIKKHNRWHSQICVNRKRVYLGSYDTAEAASEAYATASKKYHGSFGRS